MNSFNHYAIGSVAEWMWRVVAGINPLEEAPGCSSVRISPIPGGGLTWAKAGWRSIRGTIGVEWSRSAETFTLDVSIPPNMTAAVVIPGAAAAATTESGVALARAPGVNVVGHKAEGLELRVGSGSYHFRADLALRSAKAESVSRPAKPQAPKAKALKARPRPKGVRASARSGHAAPKRRPRAVRRKR